MIPTANEKRTQPGRRSDEGAPASLERRDFLVAAGFTFGAALTSCSRAPVENAIPFLIKPDEITPGKAYRYASTCGACPAACGLVVKCRDGRPIKLEGNPDHPLSRGGLCAPGQASILGLYDSHRLQGPLRDGQAVAWDELDGDVSGRLETIRAEGGKVRILTGTLHSPTARRAVAGFLEGFADARHVVFDPVSRSAILDAHARTHGLRVLPRYRFDRADVVVSFDADFLGTWIAPVEHTAGYGERRQPDAAQPRLSHHVQLESRMSLTGTKADERIPTAPWELGPAMAYLAARLSEKAGAAFGSGDRAASPAAAERLDELAEKLWDARGRSLVVCGAQDIELQSVANLLNHLLGAYGQTVELAGRSNQRQGYDAELRRLLDEIEAGEVDALLVHGVDLVHELPGGQQLAGRLKSLPLFVYSHERLDETAESAEFVCAAPHFLTAWGDAEPVEGLFTLQQPAMGPTEDARTFAESLATWSGAPANVYDQIRAVWRETVFPRQTNESDFERFWESAVQSGIVEAGAVDDSSPAEIAPDSVRFAAFTPVPGDGELSLVLYPNVGLPDASHAYNAWLQELPDPITKVTWDNYVSLSPSTAATLGVSEGDIVRLTSSDGEGVVEAPALLQPGQHDGVAAIAVGYGAKASERFADVGPRWLEARTSLGPNGRVGVNAAGLLRWDGSTLRTAGQRVRAERTGETRILAATQTHHSIEVPEHLAPRGAQRRSMVQETDWQEHEERMERWATSDIRPHESLWHEDHESTGSRWGMMIDLGACTGCSACVVGCQAENNVPVVGKDEVRRRREMHWIRIDRYYSGEGDELRTVHQPMLCQHCANAPCESVCPVLATVHSEEGLNQQVYNRCVGTRYCANNCPYKVRRFNWFDYAHEDSVENLVFNPDVTVRSRGVMEKCSFCVQRIQEAKIEARLDGRTVSDGDVQTACQQSCPAKAITFGDLNDPCSRVGELSENPRRYRVLEEMNFEPAVSYLKIVRRGAGSEEGESHG